MPRGSLDPNDFVDEPFADTEYDPDEGITMASFTIVPGDEVDHANLVFWTKGVYSIRGRSRQKWGISMYKGYHYNGEDIPIGEDHARHILETLSGTTDLTEYDWTAQDWAYFE